MKAHPHNFDFGPVVSPSPNALIRRRTNTIETLVNDGFPYSKKLSTHTSCVNALAFSSGDARWLASAGDDKFVHLWDFHQENLTQPCCGFIGHRGNAFALAFSASNRYLFSGDTDDAIHMYDISRISSNPTRSGTPLRTLHQHTGNIRSLSCHPVNDDLLLSASDDGTVKLHDTRTGIHAAQGVLAMAANFTGVQYHPTMPDLFVTGTNRGEVCLRDARSTFGNGDARVPAVHTYVTSLSKSSVDTLYRPEIGSLTFDKSGSRLAVTMLNYLPTIYDSTEPNPLAICSGRNMPDGSPVPEGERTYSNCCTIKHGSFGGLGLDSDTYYSAGSDDFRAYVWKIPGNSELKLKGEMISYDNWQKIQNRNSQGLLRLDTVAFSPTFTPKKKTKGRCIPAELATPLCRLGGHKSIVNTTLMHPYYPLILTAGVERHILLHSPSLFTSCTGSLPLTPDKVRALPGPNVNDHRVFVRALLADRTEDGEDQENMALFDHILREEGGQDVFELQSRIWDPSSDEEPVEELDNEPHQDNDYDDDLYL